jgi:hypothetical protein
MWFTDGRYAGGSFVSKFRASDGELIGTYPAGGSHTPWDLVFDGTHIWTLNHWDDSVSKLRASDGELIGTYPTGSSSNGLAFGNGHIWVSNQGDDSVSKLRASDGTLISTSLSIPINSGLLIYVDHASGGDHIWLQSGDSILKLRESDLFLGVASTQLDFGPSDMLFDGTHVWFTNYWESTVSKYSTDGYLRGTYSVDGGRWSRANQMAFDGVHIWVKSSSSTITQLRASDGALVGTYPTGIYMNYSYSSLVFDGTHIWFNGNDDSVVKMRAFDSPC